MIQAVGGGPNDAAEDHVTAECIRSGRARYLGIGVLKNRELIPAKAIFATVRETHLVAMRWSQRNMHDKPDSPVESRQHLGANRDDDMRRFSGGHS